MDKKRDPNSRQREENLSLITISNGGITAKIAPLGATLVELWVPDSKGVLGDVVLGYDTLQEYRNSTTYFGGTIGPNANRTGPPKVSLGGTEYTFAKNNGDNNLHSGPKDASKRVFQVGAATSNSVTLCLALREGDTGFPSDIELRVTYTLTGGGALDIAYKGVGEGLMVLNPTNHSYFNLAEAGDIKGHTLTLNAPFYTPLLASGLPTGEVLETQGTPLDFSAPQELGPVLASDWPQIKQFDGLDHNFVLGGRGYRQVATLKGSSGEVMELYTDRPCVQLYSGNGLGQEKGKNGVLYPQYGGLCLETQNVPNHLHLPWFASSVYEAGHVFRSKTTYKFIK